MSTDNYWSQEFLNKDWEKIERQSCEIYTRVMGYYRPVSHFNIGKKTEHYSRKHFTEEASVFKEDPEARRQKQKEDNLKFISEYGE